ncbi:MAG: haloacid dehalogenase-like hydrolase [Planctomycetaceae bacterium]|nr:haloacid dehalogenase-like hydrolase [Planctomycetaceae bacterium]
MKHVVLFDIDGTLLSTGGAGQRAMERALQSAFGLEDRAQDIPAAGRTDRAITLDLFRICGIADAPENRNRFWDAYLRHLPETLAELNGRVLPGIVEILDNLAGRGDTALGLLTGNLRTGAAAKLRYYGLDHHFQFGGYGDAHFDRDDVARLALADACRHLDRSLSPECISVVGDTPADVRCARAIGARAVAVATGMFTREELAATQPDCLLNDFSDPAEWLRHLV